LEQTKAVLRFESPKTDRTRAVTPGANESVLGLPHPKWKKVFGLLPLQSAQFLDGETRKRDGAGAVRLW